MRNTTCIVFQWQLCYLWSNFYAILRDFCFFPGGSKSIQFSGLGVPLLEKFNGEVETLGRNCLSRCEFPGGDLTFDAGPKAELNF